MKKLFLICVLIFTRIIFSNAQQKWISFNGKTESEPIIKIEKSIDIKSLIVDVEIPGVWASEIQQDGITYKRFKLVSGQTTLETGFPELPMLHCLLGLPDNTVATVEVIEENQTTIEQCNIYPFQVPEKNGSRDKPAGFLINKDYYQSSSIFPGQRVYFDKPSVWRDVRVNGLHIIPCSYQPAEKRLSFTTRMKLRINFVVNTDIEPLNRSKSISPNFYNMYKRALANCDMLGFKQLLSSADTTVKYLIITNTGALASIQPLVDWKNEQGFKTEVRTIGPGFSTPQQIKNYIQLLYTTDNLEYVLMVGDAYPDGGSAGGNNIVPMYWWAPTGEDPSFSDSWYSCLSGPDDHYADIAIGRFTYDNLAELQLQIEKTISHYKTPDTTSNWAQNSLLIAHSDGYPGKYTLCSEDIRTYNYPVQTMNFQQCYGGAGAGNTDIVNYVNNNSCGIFNYNGHGDATEFWQWGVSGSFDATHIAQLTNQNRMFVVFDLACENMDIVDYAGDCLCESFLKSPVAAVAMNGAIIPSYTVPCDDYDKEMYKAVLEEGIYNIGYITNFANVTVLNVHGNLGRSNVRTFLWLGDASLEPWTKHPEVLSVTHDPQLFLGLTSMQVIVNGLNGPEENARVCISNTNETIYGVAFTDSTGLATVQFPGPIQDPGTAKVTVTKHNYLPYQGDIIVIPTSGPYIIKDVISVDDFTGNNNSCLDYHESAMLTVSLKNVGVANAGNVEATLSTASPYVSITDSVETYGNINPGSPVNITDAYALNITANIPNNTNIIFKITATDNINTWVSSFNLVVHAPVLGIGNITISDPGGNSNGKIDPGETVSIIVPVKNTGLSEAFNVTGLLTSTDPLITINSGLTLYGNIAGSGSDTMIYSVTASVSTPAGHQSDFSFNITGDYGITTLDTFSTIIGQIPILILNFDGNNNSAPAMVTAIQSLGITVDIRTSFPPDLNIYTSVFVCLGIFPNSQMLTNSEGQILADYLNAGGILYMEGGDTWVYDSQTAVHSMFNIQGTQDGTGNLATISGFETAFTDGMSFTYTGENNYIDQLLPISPGFSIFANSPTLYTCSIANIGVNYKTIGCSFEFGGLSDATFPSTKKELMHQYLIFFGIINDPISISNNQDNEHGFRIYPNPTKDNFSIEVDHAGRIPYELRLIDVFGQSIYTEVISPEYGKISKSIRLNDFAEGIYLLQLVNQDRSLTTKLMIKK